MEYHPVVAKIKKLLEKNSFWFELFEHAPVRTSEEAANLRTGYALHQGTKAIIVRVKESGEKYFMMFVVPGDRKIDFKKVKKDFNIKDFRFATEEEIVNITEGVRIGGIPPFGNLFGLKVVVDRTVFENEKVIFNAGDRSCSIAMYSKDYKTLVKPKIAEIV